MGHGRGTYLIFFDLLLEIIHGNIGPDIAAEVGKNGIDAFQGIEVSGKVIVMLYLCGNLQPVQPQYIIHKVIKVGNEYRTQVLTKYTVKTSKVENKLVQSIVK